MHKLKFKLFTFDSDKKKIAFMIITLAAINILLYINTIHYDFLKDDFRLIVENPRIKNFQSFLESSSSKFFSFPDFPYLHYWRPFSLFSFFIDYQLWELNPSGYHLFNIIINTFNAVLIFLVFYFLFSNTLPTSAIKTIPGIIPDDFTPSTVPSLNGRGGHPFADNSHYAFLGALFFSIHPCHVEAVSWISGRTDLLSSFFIFSAILSFILFLKKRRALFKWYPMSWSFAFSIVFFILALLSKENGILFPLLALGLVYIIPHTVSVQDSPGGWRNFFKKFLITLPFWIIDIGYIILHNRFSGVRSVVEDFSLKDIFIIFKTIGAYTKIILTPFFPTHHFSMHHFDVSHLEFLVYFSVALAVLVFMFVNRETYRFSIYTLLFFIFLLPVLDPEIVPSYPKIVIRFAYIPSVFAGIFFVDTLYFIKNMKLRFVYILLLCVIGLTWMFESYRFQEYFKDQHNHYMRLARYYPEDCSLLLPLALLTAQEGDYKKALEVVDHALEVNHKDRWLDISEMGGLLKANLLVISGDLKKGKILAEEILKDTQKNEMKYFGHLVLSKYYEKLEDFPTALEILKKTEQIGETADLFFRIALLYARMGKFPPALVYVEKAITLNPTMKSYWEFQRFLIQRKKIQ